MATEHISVITEKFLVQIGDQFVPMVVRIWVPRGHPRGSVFCFHDFEGNGRDFDQMAALLCASGYQVVCPDIIGRGKSGYIGDPDSYAPDLYFQCLSALSKFGTKDNYFIGASWGGTTLLLSWAVASWKITKLILVDPPLIGSPKVDQLRDQTLKNVNAHFETRLEAERYVRHSLENENFLNSDPINELVANRVMKSGAHYRLALDPAATGNFAKLQGKNYDLFPIIAEIDAPVLILYDTKTALLDQTSIDNYLTSRPDRWAFSLNHGSKIWTVQPDQAFLVLGFLSAVS